MHDITRHLCHQVIKYGQEGIVNTFDWEDEEEAEQHPSDVPQVLQLESVKVINLLPAQCYKDETTNTEDWQRYFLPSLTKQEKTTLVTVGINPNCDVPVMQTSTSLDDNTRLRHPIKITRDISVGKYTSYLMLDKGTCTDKYQRDKFTVANVGERCLRHKSLFTLGTAEFRKVQRECCNSMMIGGCRVPVCMKSRI